MGQSFHILETNSNTSVSGEFVKPDRGLRTQRAVELYEMGLERASQKSEALGKPEKG